MSNIPKEALNKHIAILGKTGSGKTYAAKGVVEGMLGRREQCCVLDPTGAWWGLRLAADGKSKGYDVVLIGGKHADIPLSERSGAAVARLVTQQHASVVIDTTGMTVGEYTRWFIDFAGTLYTTIQSPLHLVIDEAHYFMPQGKSPDVDAGRMLHAGNRLMSGGRSLGIRGMLITQRPAKLHKDSLTCVDTLVAMKMMAPQDRQAVKDWIDGSGDPVKGKEVLDSLASLKKGEGWVWYPEGGYLVRTTFPKIKTYDSSATPEHGAKRGPEVGSINLDEVRASMSEAVKEAEANDPKLLRARLAKAQAELAAAQRAAPAPKADAAAVERAVARAVTDRDKHWKGELAKWQKTAVLLTSNMSKIAGLTRANGVLPTPAEAVEPPKIIVPASPVIPSDRAKPTRAPVKIDGDWSGPQLECIRAFAWFKAIGIHEPTKEQICFRCGWRSTSGHINNVLGSLRSAGMIDGYRLVGDVPAPEIGTLDEYHGQIRRTLDGPQSLVFNLLLANHPKVMDKESVCDALGWSATSGHINNVVGALRSFGVVEKRGWSLSPMVFPEGLT